MNPLFLVINVVLAYFIGAIPVAYMAGRFYKNIDIREYGSGNMGATNAFRVLGKGPGTLVLLLDILKGLIPITLLANIFDLHAPLALVLIAVAAVAGHNWTVFMKFKGGKGMATSLGVLIGLAIQLPGIRVVLGAALLTWLVIFFIFGYVSVASIAAAVVFPIMMVAVNAPFSMKVMAIGLCMVIVFKHKSNIRRLMRGQENRVYFPFHKRPY
ncbi:MAG: glycerol-3-phosphate 1-O-acyltransferase PlsY [Candidatus Omnitrophica bacterium]|nr:glycerol-3-phosphate 1-O-acyltransferase PlsY [Candidatus Omnitrophota bacterium]